MQEDHIVSWIVEKWGGSKELSPPKKGIVESEFGIFLDQEEFNELKIFAAEELAQRFLIENPRLRSHDFQKMVHIKFDNYKEYKRIVWGEEINKALEALAIDVLSENPDITRSDFEKSTGRELYKRGLRWDELRVKAGYSPRRRYMGRDELIKDALNLINELNDRGEKINKTVLEASLHTNLNKHGISMLYLYDLVGLKRPVCRWFPPGEFSKSIKEMIDKGTREKQLIFEEIIRSIEESKGRLDKKEMRQVSQSFYTILKNLENKRDIIRWESYGKTFYMPAESLLYNLYEQGIIEVNPSDIKSWDDYYRAKLHEKFDGCGFREEVDFDLMVLLLEETKTVQEFAKKYEERSGQAIKEKNVRKFLYSLYNGRFLSRIEIIGKAYDDNEEEFGVTPPEILKQKLKSKIENDCKRKLMELEDQDRLWCGDDRCLCAGYPVESYGTYCHRGRSITHSLDRSNLDQIKRVIKDYFRET